MEEMMMNEDNDSLRATFINLFDEFTQQVNDDGNILIPYAGENLMSIEALTLNFANCIIDDINMVLELKKQNFDHRYADGIIRNICEQVIEFIFLHKNPDKLPEYFSAKTDEEYEVLEKEIEEDADLCMVIRKIIGDKRYVDGRNIKKMVVDINEEKGKDDGLSLDEVYQYTSTLYHNSYLENLFDLVGEVEEEDGISEDVVEDVDVDFLIMTTILTKFLEKYDAIVAPVRDCK